MLIPLRLFIVARMIIFATIPKLASALLVKLADIWL